MAICVLSLLSSLVVLEFLVLIFSNCVKIIRGWQMSTSAFRVKPLVNKNMSVYPVWRRYCALVQRVGQRYVIDLLTFQSWGFPIKKTSLNLTVIYLGFTNWTHYIPAAYLKVNNNELCAAAENTAGLILKHWQKCNSVLNQISHK